MGVINRTAKKRYFKASLIKSFDKLRTNGNLLGSAALSPFVVRLSNHLCRNRYERKQQANRFLKKPECNSLHALTAAALVLPGLMQPILVNATEDDSVDFQYSHYQEGKRDIYQGVYFSDLTAGISGINGSHKQSYNNPIEVDSVHGSGRFSLTDRIKFSFNYLQDTWSGATPVGTAPALLSANGSYSPEIVNSGASPYGSPSIPTVYIDNKGNMYGVKNSFIDGSNTIGAQSNQITHVMSYASPETRKQGDFSLSYDWDEAAVNVGGGISVENDYESRFVNLGGRMDFNQKQTTVNVGVSYTNSDTFAKLDPDSLNFISTEGYDEQYFDDTDGSYKGYRPIAGAPGQIESDYTSLSDGGNFRSSAILHGKRQDWGTQLGLTQVLTSESTMELGFGYTRSTGYLANPYKLVYFLSGTLNVGDDPNAPILYNTGGGARLEKRPEERNQFNWNLGYNHYLPFFDAALHFDYRFSHDDWGINAHTFEADWVQPLGTGWTATPRIRYYSQSGADFYTPFVKTLAVNDPATGEKVNSPYTREAPEFYSSDQRLSGFGALSGGVTIAKQFGKGVSLETGFEYYTHQGNLKIGGGGEQAFADYDYWVANAALKLNLEAAGAPGSSTGHISHHQHSNSPAGVMFDHALEKSGDFMVGYRYMRSEQAGNMLLGSHSISPDNTRNNGCGDQACAVAPKSMVMNMHMLDLMVAPTDWFSLMLMPQWMDMNMDMTPLSGFVSQTGHNHGGSTHNHQTGGIGDTGLYALFKLFDQPNQHLTLSLGGTAPTGDVDIKLRTTSSITNKVKNVPLHYGMQLGSGTWDFKPSLTYTGEADSFIWGAQATGTKRLESRNSAGFAFGDSFQGSVWGGYQWTNWLTTTVRGIYATQGSIRGEYPAVYYANRKPPQEFKLIHVGPFDKTNNYGGKFWDLGLGVNINIPHGTFAGNSLKFEWLQPVHTDYNGYQLDRDYTFNFTWSYGF
ncbi:MAG: DUF3570 domain-containing protein [Methyloglobulus sp.]